ncbi:hypothetical protein BGW36DRAFT_407484 [Talaromyces proteolyticus]|uniref:Uncharacterized protein n=1 Tax=Talaromyces proteolyticus TaxID=1131652 RepID=A0AAD4KV83_9EURO|nr:uncharacterized protein BGW36DRAFT_407484 [Talaromyces proteolyticus]KAH8697476.1 hypothetical protein BGW36DRAFT_407484 [Talaromyces proteolyticus]
MGNSGQPHDNSHEGHQFNNIQIHGDSRVHIGDIHHISHYYYSNKLKKLHRQQEVMRSQNASIEMSPEQINRKGCTLFPPSMLDSYPKLNPPLPKSVREEHQAMMQLEGFGTSQLKQRQTAQQHANKAQQTSIQNTWSGFHTSAFKTRSATADDFEIQNSKTRQTSKVASAQPSTKSYAGKHFVHFSVGKSVLEPSPREGSHAFGPGDPSPNKLKLAPTKLRKKNHAEMFTTSAAIATMSFSIKRTISEDCTQRYGDEPPLKLHCLQRESRRRGDLGVAHLKRLSSASRLAANG